jgi:hypothetical protein
MLGCQEGDDATDIVRLRKALKPLHAERKLAASFLTELKRGGQRGGRCGAPLHTRSVMSQTSPSLRQSKWVFPFS